MQITRDEEEKAGSFDTRIHVCSSFGGIEPNEK